MPLPRLTDALSLHARLESGLSHLLGSADDLRDDFLQPVGEAALLASDSVSWRIFKNPLALFVGGVAAVVLELAEPRVGTGVWEYTSFRERPLERLRRTGSAALLTVYGPRSRAEAMIAGVARLHDQVRGTAPDGRTFCANDPELLEWVHATATFGFIEAYHAYVRPLTPQEHDRFYAEAVPVARRYGAERPPGSKAELEALFARMAGQLQRSARVFEFLGIMRRMPALPRPLRPLQSLLVDAAVQLVAPALRGRIGLGAECDRPAWQLAGVRQAGAAADRIVLRTHPAVQACRRLGLADDYLYSRGNG